MVRGAEECTSGGQVQMKHCHRRRGHNCCLAWQGGPTPLPGSLRERLGLLLLPGPQKPRWPQSLHTNHLDPAARWPRPKAHEFPLGGRVLLQAWPSLPKPSQAQLTLRSSGLWVLCLPAVCQSPPGA